MNVVECSEAQTNLIKHYEWVIEKTKEETRLLDIELTKLQTLEKRRKEVTDIILNASKQKEHISRLGKLPTLRELQEIKAKNHSTNINTI